jgi:predicted nucleic acid-binding protein
MLLDTSGLFCLHHRNEPRNGRASTLFRSARRRITHSYVLAEFIALVEARGLPRGPALSFLRDLIANPRIEVVWVGAALNQSGIDLLEVRLDKSYSLCDAVSFILMRQRGIHEALTTDHHFDQEGFQRLLR